MPSRKIEHERRRVYPIIIEWIISALLLPSISIWLYYSCMNHAWIKKQSLCNQPSVSVSDFSYLILCHSDPKTELAVAAFETGKHVFIEKPMCYSLQEADAIGQAARKARRAGQVGYMKVYDPASELAKREVGDPDEVRFVQVNHLHPNNSLHLKQFKLTYFDDIPEEAGWERQHRSLAGRPRLHNDLRV